MQIGKRAQPFGRRQQWSSLLLLLRLLLLLCWLLLLLLLLLCWLLLLLPLLLLLLWLLLNQSISPGHILLGAVVGLAGGWGLATLELPRAHVRRPVAICRLAGVVFLDIAKSNLAVARLILGLGRNKASSGFVEIPLELDHPYGLAVLACIITSTPGTVWVDFDPATRTLTIHVLDVVDEAQWVRTIKDRYERPLLQIFA
jgi:multicomponent K+:H+ antiporter subunit E